MNKPNIPSTDKDLKKRRKKLRPPPPPLRKIQKISEAIELTVESSEIFGQSPGGKQLGELRAASEQLSGLVNGHYLRRKPYGATFIPPQGWQQSSMSQSFAGNTVDKEGDDNAGDDDE